MVTSDSMRGMTIVEGLYSVFTLTPSRRNPGEEAMRKITIALAFLVAWFSAKYEVEHGKLQLSVYTTKGDTFSEVIVDHKTGKVAKADPIAGGNDLAAAKAQSEAMAKAKRSLDAAASEAVKDNKGYRVVSVMPALKEGHPVADVTLVKGSEWKTVSEKLD